MIQGGVIFFRKDACTELWKEVKQVYQTSTHFCDQIVVRKLLWERKVPFYMLPPEYNFNRTSFLEDAQAKDYQGCLPRILHYTDDQTKQRFETLPEELEPFVRQILSKHAETEI